MRTQHQNYILRLALRTLGKLPRIGAENYYWKIAGISHAAIWVGAYTNDLEKVTNTAENLYRESFK